MDKLTKVEILTLKKLLSSYEFTSSWAYFKGEKGDDGADGKSVDEDKVIDEIFNKIILPKDGKDAVVDYDRLFSYIDKKMSEIPRPKDGRHGTDGISPKIDYDSIYKKIELEVSKIPRPKDGSQGEKGNPGKDGKSVGYVTEIVYRYIKESDIENLRQQLVDTYSTKEADEIIKNLEPAPLDELTDKVIRDLATKRGIL